MDNKPFTFGFFYFFDWHLGESYERSERLRGSEPLFGEVFSLYVSLSLWEWSKDNAAGYPCERGIATNIIAIKISMEFLVALYKSG